jgi:serine/threonine protein kinase
VFAGEIPAECRVPAEAFDLLARMLEYDPSARITCEEALKHPYFTIHQPLPTANVLCAAVSARPAFLMHSVVQLHGKGGLGGAPQLKAS